ncbi:Oidioi.mRNA.OKI2018_I69.chr1.g1690.t1.cds [Oikopleura dioica]|uniref:Oidioi.mRNA.OKI2018_I69.chr1.g1679.t1.cds n=1 Tax=Oikopleura dioica TaxID=34765 RepID=A0ABN7STQ5_OIKDI|nr:Oidioi.mRNA.OKI2018_I69.chr1.g1679.t1.cds [Oikopleura dioica]CAG5104934.1 Oidioi.mRNA.OKI2018_I69.chr1.g1685.t1.cds [Oikopleura dioica]CAG5104940.1 Oidioi.mRNA.OKI2018_I69.chr1.g1690.t1.cds [Oikopleura dioica]
MSAINDFYDKLRPDQVTKFRSILDDLRGAYDNLDSAQKEFFESKYSDGSAADCPVVKLIGNAGAFDKEATTDGQSHFCVLL